MTMNSRDPESYGTGHDDGLEPLVPLDIGRLDTVDALVKAMSKTAFGGRRLGEAADTLEAMVRDESCFRVVTISGAMTIAKQGLVLCEMIERGWVQAVVATGALMTHGVVEGAGMLHFKHRQSMKDEDLFERGYNRVYDTIELEKNLNDTELLISEVLSKIEPGTTICSHDLLARVGEMLEDNDTGRAILRSAVQKKVPIYVPAFSDSELGLDFAIHNRRLRENGEIPFAFDPFLDLEDFADRVRQHESLGIFTIGGGVPRNWAQQIAPYLEISADRLGKDEPIRRFRYAVRICPEPEHWGGLSGCSYSEGVSWGKFVPESEGGRHAEVHADATIAWPIIVRAVLERLEAKPAGSDTREATTRMRAAVVNGDGSISTTSVPIPICGPNEVRVRVDACGLCGSDLHAQRNASWSTGLIPGHEIAGRIEALGQLATKGGDGGDLVTGLPVVVEPLESCSNCPACQSGRDSICPELRIAGVHRPGGLAEFVSVPAERVYAFSPEIDPAVATLIEPLAVALHALDRGQLRTSDRVLVLGGGTIGLLCAFAARNSGAAEVSIRARHAHQRQLSLDLGIATPHDAALSISESGLESHFDLVIETVGGMSETLNEACAAAKPGARIVVLGLFEPNPPFDPSLALEKELELVWGNCYQTGTMADPDFARAARGLAEHHLNLRHLVTHRSDLERIEESFALAGNKRSGVGKVAVMISRA